jgi:alkylation response protein AidB-like acyl-CoA dehydrogenase
LRNKNNPLLRFELENEVDSFSRLAGGAGRLEPSVSREVPKDLVEAVRRCGVFRMYTPRTHGGLELDFLDSLEVITEGAGVRRGLECLSQTKLRSRVVRHTAIARSI